MSGFTRISKFSAQTDIFEPIDVCATFNSSVVSSFENSILSPTLSSSATATAQALSKPSAILIG